jgi:molybdenum ABC transporter molybdate-binding protein
MMLRLRRTAQLNGPWLAFLLSVFVFIVLVVLLAWDQPWVHRPQQGPGGKSAPLLVYCAAGLKAPVEAAANDYKARYGTPIQLQFGGSGSLLANAEVSRRGDLFLAADDLYLRLAADKQLLDETLDLARMHAVIAVPKGNPRSIHSLADLLHEDVRLSFALPEAAAIGKLAREALVKAGRWEAISKRIVATQGTVNDVLRDVIVGSVDAGIVWDALIPESGKLEAVKVPELASAEARVAVGVLRTTEQPTAALRFARFLAARDAGLLQFRERGYEVVDGDRWAEEPELRLLCGAMLRPAIEETLQAFEQREGVRITRVYNGCGILVAQMRTGQEPDAYFACDQSFMDQVHDLFLRPVPVSNNRLVIIVLKGNPKEIHNLDDLAKPGLRVGIGHEKQCALGVLTQKTLVESKLREAVMKNVRTQTPTGDMLVNQLLAKSLDAVVAYVSNAAEAGDQVETIPVDVPCALAVQPLAVGKHSDFRHLAERLAIALRSPQSKQRFEAAGFHWGEAKPAR